MQAKHKNTGRWEGVKPRLSHFQVCLAAKKCGPVFKNTGSGSIVMWDVGVVGGVRGVRPCTLLRLGGGLGGGEPGWEAG
jgi:hypothetical protein